MKRKGIGLMTGIALSVFAMAMAPVSFAAEKRSLANMTEEEKEQCLLTQEYDKTLMDTNTTLFFPSKYYKKSSKKKTKVSNAKESVTIPAKYDSRDKGVISSVKQQGMTGCCWAFGIQESAQAGFMSKYHPTKEMDLSEYQLAYFMYNQPVDDLSLVGKDDVSASYYGDVGSYGYYQIGGNAWLSIFGMSRGIGVCKEEDAPFNTVLKKLDKGKTAVLNDEKCYQENDYVLDFARIAKASDKDSVKQLVMENGAGTISYYSDWQYYDYNYFSFYNPNASENEINHIVSIVGWDDNYPKEKFYYEPEHDGAWLIKNSWGEEWGDDGYFWLSYDEPSIQNGDVIFYNIENNSTYDHVYQYDGTLSYEMTEENYTHMANVFTAKQNETLQAVSFHTVESNTDCTVSIYKNITDSANPCSGKLVALNLTGSYQQPGYYTIHLDEAISVQKGETFAVVVKETCGGNPTTFYVDRDQDNDWVVSDNTSSAGESFVSKDGSSWEDISADGNSNMRIKVFSKVAEEETLTGTVAFKETDYTIKANETQMLDVMMGDKVVNDSLKLTFKTADSRIASIDSLGNIYGKKSGTTKVTVSYGGETSECTLTVTENPLEEIKKAENYAEKNNPIQLFVGQSCALEYEVEPAGTSTEIQWSVVSNKEDDEDEEYEDDEDEDEEYSYASVSKKGVFSAERSGIYEIKAEAQVGNNKISQSFWINVTFDKTDCSDNFEKMSYLNYDNNTVKVFTYANTDKDALVHFKEGFSLEKEFDYIYVFGADDDYNLDELYGEVNAIANDYYDEDETPERVSYVGRYTGTELDNQSIRVNGKNIIVFFVSDLYKTDKGFQVDKIEKTVPITSIAVSETVYTMEAGTEGQLEITTVPQENNDSLYYESSNTKVVTVDQFGKMTAHKKGTASITVASEYGDVVEEVEITVTSADIEKITPIETNLDLIRNASEQITFAEDLSKYVVEYSSNHPEIACVDENGLVRAAGIGEAIITAKVGEVQATVTVKVSAPDKMTVEDMQSIHDYVPGMTETYEYTAQGENVNSLKLYLHSKTQLTGNDYIEILDGNDKVLYTLEKWDVPTSEGFIIQDKTVKIKLYTGVEAKDEDEDYYDEEDYDEDESAGVAYGFKVRAIEEGVIPTDIQLTPITIDLNDYSKRAVKLKPTFLPADANVQAEVEYKVADEKLAYVENGVLYANYNGSTTITASVKTGDTTLTCEAVLTIMGNPIESIKCNNDDGEDITEITIDDETELQLQILPEDYTEYIKVENTNEDIVYSDLWGDTLYLEPEESGTVDITLSNPDGSITKTIRVISTYEEDDDEDDEDDDDSSGISWDKVTFQDGNQGKAPELMTINDFECHPYEDDMRKKWTYYNKDAESIAITFSADTEVEDECDYIYILDCNLKQIGCYTGTELANKTITIPGQGFSIVLWTDGSVIEYGFKLTNLQVKSKTVENQQGSQQGSQQGGQQIQETNVQAVTGIKIEGISHYLAPGKKLKLKTSVLPENAANKNVIYQSSNAKYATVSTAGVVKATKKGAGKTVNITVSAADGSGVKAVYKVKITKQAVKSLKVTAAKKAKAGSKVKLKTKVKAGKGAYKKVSYTCLTPKYASVSSKGVVSIKKSAKKKVVKIQVMTLDGTNKKKVIRIKVK